jgi:hypothetical protein
MKQQPVSLLKGNQRFRPFFRQYDLLDSRLQVTSKDAVNRGRLQEVAKIGKGIRELGGTLRNGRFSVSPRRSRFARGDCELKQRHTK